MGSTLALPVGRVGQLPRLASRKSQADRRRRRAHRPPTPTARLLTQAVPCVCSPLCETLRARSAAVPPAPACSTQWRSGTRWWTPRSRGSRPGACCAPRAPSRSRRRPRPRRPSPARGPGTVPPSRSGSTATRSTDGSLKVGAKQTFLSPSVPHAKVVVMERTSDAACDLFLYLWTLSICLGGEIGEKEEKLDGNLILFSGNDYMGLSSHPAVREAAVKVCPILCCGHCYSINSIK